MMKKLIVIGCLVLLCGCAEKMTNEQIVKETKYCVENGLDYRQIKGGK